MSEVLAQREAVMVGLPMARWIDNIRENCSFFHDNCYRLFVQAHRCWCHCHCRERNRGKFHRLSKSDFWEFESFPFTGAAICGRPGLSFPGWVATGTEGRGCHTGRILPLYDQQNIWKSGHFWDHCVIKSTNKSIPTMSLINQNCLTFACIWHRLILNPSRPLYYQTFKRTIRTFC